MAYESLEQFIAKYKYFKFDSEKVFLLFCKEGVELAKHFPAQKDRIAYEIVGKGSTFGELKDDIISDIREQAMGLELPDQHVYTGHGLSVAQQWRLLEEYVDKGLKAYNA